MSNTIRRDWLRRQVEKGLLEAKCDFHYTDDYALDNAQRFGKTDWKPARVRKPVFENRTLPNGNIIPTCFNSDYLEGYINFNDSDFEGQTGRAHWNKNKTEISLSIHSNLHYTLRYKESEDLK